MIDAVARAPMNTKLRHSFPARFAVAEIAGLKALDTRQDAGLGLSVTEIIQPVREGFTAVRRLLPDQVEHKTSVTYMLQDANPPALLEEWPQTAFVIGDDRGG